LVQVDDPGFALAMPDGWITISGEDVTNTGIFEQLAEDNPEAAAAMEQARTAIESGQMSFLGVETGRRTIEAGFAANLNVVHVPDPGSFSAEEVAAQMKVALPLQIPGAKVVETETTDVPAGEAAIVRTHWTLKIGTESLALDLTQYMILTGGEGFILSFTAPRDTIGDYRDVWVDIAESFSVD
jgi:hypothetical protein